MTETLLSRHAGVGHTAADVNEECAIFVGKLEIFSQRTVVAFCRT